jgi:hypothetical protein
MSLQITICTNLLPIIWVTFLKNSVVGENFGVKRTVVTTNTESQFACSLLKTKTFISNNILKNKLCIKHKTPQKNNTVVI